MALATVLRANLADTTTLHDSRRLPDLPDSARFYFTLTGETEVDGDTATIDVFGGKAAPPTSPAELEVLRYMFVARNGRWVFVKRTILWAT